MRRKGLLPSAREMSVKIKFYGKYVQHPDKKVYPDKKKIGSRILLLTRENILLFVNLFCFYLNFFLQEAEARAENRQLTGRHRSSIST